MTAHQDASLPLTPFPKGLVFPPPGLSYHAPSRSALLHLRLLYDTETTAVQVPLRIRRGLHRPVRVRAPQTVGLSHHPHPSTETVLSIPDTSVTNSQVLAGGTALSASPRSRAAGQALSEVLGFKPKHFVKSKLPQRGTEELRYPKPAAGADLEPIIGLLDYLFMVLLFLSQAQFTLCVSSRRLGGPSPTQELILQPPKQPRSSRLPKRTVH